MRFFQATSAGVRAGQEDTELQEAEGGSSESRKDRLGEDRVLPLQGCSRQCLCHLDWEV